MAKSREELEALIAQMLAKAESTTPAEAEMIMGQVEKLMIRHGIEEAAVEAAKLGKDRSTEKIVEKSMTFEGGYAKGHASIANSVCNALGELRVLGSKVHYPKSGERVHIIGYERDVDRAITLVNSLVLQATVAMAEMWRNRSGEFTYYSAAEKFQVRRSFLFGFGEGAARRIVTTKLTVISEVKSSTPGAELVLVDRKDAVDKWVGDKYPKLGKGRGAKVVGSGYGEGVRAGKNANVGNKGVQASRPALRG